MKKFFIILAIFTFIVASLFYADSQSEDGLIEDIRYIILPDPMTNNLYDEGECTYYVFDLVKNDLNMIENSWGDAEHWAERAEADGYTVNQSPEAGALLQTSSGEIGHVAYVTDVNNDGSIEISEMNFYEQYEITERTIDSEDISDYNFIHPKENPRPKDTLE